MDGSNSRIVVSPDLITEVQELLEDTCEYICREEFNAGSPLSGETYWKIVECLAIAKQAEMQGIVVPDECDS